MKSFKYVIAICVLAISPFALAGTVAVMDPQGAILGTELAKQRMDALKNKPEFSKMIAEAEGLQADLSALSEEAKTSGLTWGPDQKAENRKNLEYVQADLKLLVQKIQKEQNDVMQGLMAEGQQTLPPIIKQIVDAKGIELVLHKEVAIYALPTLDITPDIIAAFNKLNAAKK